MTPRRTRLLIVAAAVAVAVLGAGWLSRPQIDPRLVGTWKYEGRSDGRLQYHADGTVWFEFDNGQFKLLSRSVRWSSDGSILVVTNGTAGTNLIPTVVQRWYEATTSDYVVPYSRRETPIFWIDADTMRIGGTIYLRVAD